MFKYEHIYEFKNKTLKVVGCEVLASTAIPNTVLFSTHNIELEYYMFQCVMQKRLRIPYNHSTSYFWTFNLSPAAIERHFEEIVSSAPDNLFIEITERGEFSKDFSSMKQIRNKLILDDFGTGISNMDILHHVRPYGVKIDRVMFNCSKNYLMSLVSELREYVKVIIAEKVETEEELQLMREIGVDFYQGFYMPSALKISKYQIPEKATK
jgi:EAL domain-containing protein (putative c-di-GMP-specific phosphodiesterase class I)